MKDNTHEALVILQEECAEVIQAISKCYRFGFDSTHKNGITQRSNLEEEIGDMLCLMEYLIAHGELSRDNIESAKVKKVEKLKVWSKLYGEKMYDASKFVIGL